MSDPGMSTTQPMSTDEMMAYANSIAGGGKIVKPDVVRFMQALLADAGSPVAPSEPDPAPALPSPHVRRIAGGDGSVHVNIARLLTKDEARALARAILAAAE